MSDVSRSLRLAISSSLTSPRENDTQDNDHQPKMPLGIELTGYRLLNSATLAIAVPVAVYSYKEKVVTSTTLGLLMGISAFM